MMMMRYTANPVSEGIAIGEAFHYIPYTPTVTEGAIAENEIAATIAEYETARERAKAELAAIQTKLSVSDPEKAKIFNAHTDILFDAAMDEDIRDDITDDCYTARWAVHKVYEKYIKVISKSKNEMIRERAADMRDVKTRLLRCMDGIAEKNLATLEKPVVVVAYDLFPSDTATLDRKNVLAIITEVGG
ncbi:MAG: phosphoenolpyruvate-utilizing N-terminal domain-containing protein, partial [Angelakisella sp.]